MRSETRARWATSALAITILTVLAVPAATAGRKKSLVECTAFDMVDRDEETVDLTIYNRCTIPVDCAISWRVICAPESKSRRASHPGSVKLDISNASTGSAQASATICGEDAWRIESIQWSCLPDKD